ncbi:MULTISPECIES: TIGR03862 family flavoprotein [Rhodanobacter]|uniref:TIGR03862 family flavoprotein n=1 Tax=Rhodanobacter TaxID=75309 RepID=UPI000401BDF1|nr:MULTISPECIES: TIGR03862 family flavoprotein [Rhodanobacter]UJJ50850.1 TIGR03862 family flavoprotein [Rhodanobacter denitrificans]UJJ56950.1 TIGR03862 family flavoprotein [Rhodanobacter denitrificans]UJM93565.1 TIGR03862 family flavoprotein [Rhodanobacter denitrificans]UJM97096.1 TIGR03862 family flavoprotein [Rhodanobacter denitrificans]UJN20076.1 TIGR03862 family flavoprotein [Rhodanobacter denitrificans]
MTRQASPRLAIIGGGPAGLMAAEAACAAGVAVDLYEAKGSVGRKFLLAGKGGLNLTHGEPRARFVERYGARRDEVGRWLDAFDAEALRAWARGLGVETFAGSSGRVFPADLKAAPLLRGWLRRLRESGVAFHVHHRWLGWSDGALRFATAQGERTLHAEATVLALGGASWPQLGSDGAWVAPLRQACIDVAPLQPANCGFELAWSEHLASRFAGAPLKPVVAHWVDRCGVARSRQGEFVLSEYGIEGSLIYAIGAELREQIAERGEALLKLDLVPGYPEAVLAERLAAPRGRHSLGDWLRRRAGLDKAKCALLFELADKAILADPATLATRLKALPLRLRAPRPVAEAISTAGGVRLEALDENLMLRARPGVFCAGEMLDWEAPTGGYLLTACFASGLLAGRAAARRLLGAG